MSGFLTYLWVSVRRWWIRWRAPKEKPEREAFMWDGRIRIPRLIALVCGLTSLYAFTQYQTAAKESEFRKINAETEYRIERTRDELVRIQFLIDRMGAR